MPSIKDVAALAGVAVGTVSRVINNNGTVTPEIRNRVIAAIEQLKYVPNEVARNFKMQKSNLIALLLPTVWHPFFSELAYYVEDELDDCGYKLLLCNSGGKPWKESYYLDMLEQNKVAGILGISYNNLDHAVKHDIPMISIDRHFRSNIACVTSDNQTGGRMALHELRKAGVRKPAFLGSTPQVSSEITLRREGFVQAAAQAGLEVIVYEPDEPIVDEDTYFAGFFEVAEEIDGLFAINDLLAANYIIRAAKRGIRVPEDVKLIGYDGIQNDGLFHPNLSTIRQPVEEMARMSVRLLLQLIAGQSLEEKVYRLPVYYREGDTT
ncbi:LacI family DNA-binding transcriptional regulator [Gorillibacterium timonense]|uniref:LacI family DNA-binding transcriptional regulator n=1 Tax=Gorillibacterium timonense TaxID=1689269 RepID=UPI00071C3F60|nr:LacI family DNA-binding transcriptional regulator [Gorillibacterium timonense]